MTYSLGSQSTFFPPTPYYHYWFTDWLKNSPLPLYWVCSDRPPRTKLGCDPPGGRGGGGELQSVMTPIWSQSGEEVTKGQKIWVILDVWPLTGVSKTQLFSYFLSLQHSREARRKMPHLVNFEQIFHKTLSERHFGI